MKWGKYKLDCLTTTFKYRIFTVHSSQMTMRSEFERRNGLDSMATKILGEEQLSEWNCRPVILRNEEKLKCVEL